MHCLEEVFGGALQFAPGPPVTEQMKHISCMGKFSCVPSLPMPETTPKIGHPPPEVTISSQDSCSWGIQAGTEGGRGELCAGLGATCPSWGREHLSSPGRRECCPKTTQLPLPCGSPIPVPMVTFPGGCSLRLFSGLSGADFQGPRTSPHGRGGDSWVPTSHLLLLCVCGGGREVPGWAEFRGYPFAAPPIARWRGLGWGKLAVIGVHGGQG